ncbi:glycine zipper 2TM domain-containing protein [Phenylobacterium sp.]|uniref:glycine zipper 2TM domain-containing protein n=1 Tax=Phenylobacterium sp. TaxID=1871053 RepID=UPI002626F49D|nr:glycine zipper 2TM domain-containing protein [Phenylobacterium sp.]
MRRTLLAAVGLALAVSSAAQARSGCEAYAHNRRVTGTVVGALGGGLLGSAVAGHGSKGTGALVGAGLGAVVGNNLSRVSCDHRAYYRRHRSHYARARTRAAPAYARYPRYASSYRAGSCHYVSRPYYDQAGRLVYAPMQVCE